MDDYVSQVRQIAQFPQVTPQPGDLLLVQQGGIGGAYASATIYDALVSALNANAGIFQAGNVGLNPAGGLFWGNSISGASMLWEPLGGLTYTFITGGLGIEHLHIDVNGNMTLPRGTLSVARSPINANDVATKQWTELNFTASWNGRTGKVVLLASDVNAAFKLEPGDSMASQSWVDAHICQSLQQFYSYSPLVFSFNGRVGSITLTLDDINTANFSVPGSYPQAPSPALGDASNNIATTAFVDETIQDAVDTVNSSWSAADLAILDMLQTQYAPLNSPSFTGNPTAPMPPAGSNDATLATTAWVMGKITSAVTGVTEWNGRTGAVTLEAADVSGVGGALLDSPALTGSPTAPSPPVSDNSNRLATTAWVLGEIGAVSAGVTTWNGRSGAVTMAVGDITGAGGAPINSPAMTGTPTAPTPPAADSSTRLATTAWVASYSVISFNGRAGAVSLQLNDITAAGGAPLASPTFTGIPAAPTAAPGTNTTQLATTAYVQAAIGAGGSVTSVNGRTGAVVLNTADITAAGGAVLEQVIPNCGRLTIAPNASPSNIIYYAPYNGQQIKIAGKIYTFSSSMQSASNNSYVNGVPGQTLAAANTYYVYAFWNPGGSSVLMDFSMTGYVLDTTAGNEGVAVKSNDNTRSLIGIVRMTATGLFADSPDNRLVRSWFNRRSVMLSNATAINHQVTTLGTNINLINANFAYVSFADDSFMIAWGAQVQSVGGASTAYAMISIDGTVVGVGPSAYMAVAGSAVVVPNLYSFDALSEGYHVVQGVGQVLSQQATYLGFMHGRLIQS